jgi:hypothetical protein
LGRLVQCALIAQRYSPYLKGYYEKVKKRRSTGKAIIALGPQVPGHRLSNAQIQMGVRRFPNLVLAQGTTE